MVIKNYINLNLIDVLIIKKSNFNKNAERRIFSNIIMKKKDLELTYNVKFNYIIVSDILLSIIMKFPEFSFNDSYVENKIYGYLNDLNVGMNMRMKKEEIIFTTNETEFYNFERILKIQDINDN